MQDKKKNSVLDVTIVHMMCQYEYALYKLIDDTFPRKFKNTLTQQLVDSIGEARESLVASMSYPSRYIASKYQCLCKSQAKLHNVEILLNYLNDMQVISDITKASLDTHLFEIYGNLERLLNSFKTQLTEKRQSAKGTPDAENSEINQKDTQLQE